MSRTAWLSVVGLGLLVAGGFAAWRWPSSQPALGCPPEALRFETRDGQPFARCDSQAPLSPVPAAAGLVVGVKLDLNRATAEELTLVPGVGERLARDIVRRRDVLNGFREWSELDQIDGIGPAKLAAIRSVAELRAPPPPPSP